jgi:hypothetical protein
MEIISFSIMRYERRLLCNPDFSGFVSFLAMTVMNYEESMKKNK